MVIPVVSIDLVVVRVPDDGGQRAELTEVVLGELDDLGVLVVPGEDDDHAVDRSRRLLVVLVDRAVAIRVHGSGNVGARGADVEDALVLQHRLDGPLVLEAGDGLESRRRVLVGVGGRVGRLLEDVDLLRQDDVDRITRGDEEVEPRRAVDLEGDRLLPGLEECGDVEAPGPWSPAPIASPLTCEPAGTANSAGCPDTWDTLESPVPITAAGSTSCSSTLSGVTGSPMSMSSVATSTVTVVGSSGRAGSDGWLSRTTIATKARTASRTPTRMTRRFDRFTNVPL